MPADAMDTRATRWAGIAVLAWAAVTLGACGSPCAVLDPTAERVVYYASDRPQTARAEHEYRTADGAVLGYVEHRAAAPVAAIVYLHGIESHSAWFDAAADGLCARGFDVYCLDRRGSGMNRENRGFRSGHVDHAETLIADIRDFVRPLRDRYAHVFLAGLAASWRRSTRCTTPTTSKRSC
jgi:pimeloyl-ACP methyl ester carboxylesterase